MTVNTNKVQAARDILQSLDQSKDADSAKLLAQTSQLIEGYIELADHRQDPCEYGVNYPLTNKLKNIKFTEQTSRVAVPTYNAGEGAVNIPKVGNFRGWTYPGPPFLPSLMYFFMWMTGLSFSFQRACAGGITKPKKISCWSTDGREFLQIVKGGEDPRADSITSQLFCVINLLLRGNRACRKRALEVRTYKVIPLHPQVRARKIDG